MARTATAPAIAKDPQTVLHEVVVKGDLSSLSERDRTQYYVAVCNSVGLNPLTKPLEYIKLNGKLVLYARKDATDQLRQIHGVSIEKVEEREADGALIVVAYARNAQGRGDVDVGGVSLVYPRRFRDPEDGKWKNHPRAGQRLDPEDYANALMKATTKAKRRVTLSICGLGILDESEIRADESAIADVNVSEWRKPEVPSSAAPAAVTDGTDGSGSTVQDLIPPAPEIATIAIPAFDADQVPQAVKAKIGEACLKSIKDGGNQVWDAALGWARKSYARHPDCLGLAISELQRAFRDSRAQQEKAA